MLSRLDKFAPYLVILLFAYLTHSARTGGGLLVAEGSKVPVIDRNRLNATLVEPQAAASPVDRDPFDVEWASYLPPVEPEPASQPTTGPTSQPATAAPPEPVVARPPPMPKRFTAVITARDAQIAIIDGSLYKPGSLIRGTDPQLCWRVETIRRKAVVLRFGKEKRTLTIWEDVRAADVPQNPR